jgi:hypothetical protein
VRDNAVAPARRAGSARGQVDPYLDELETLLDAYLTACRSGTFEEINTTLWALTQKLHGYYNVHAFPRLTQGQY